MQGFILQFMCIVLAHLYVFACTMPINNISLEKTGCTSERWSTCFY